jgi:plasmid maintenance system antidote protein VapI
MGAPKISAMENEPRNLTMGTLIRLAHALGSRWRLNWCAGRDEGGAAAK